MGNCIGKAGSGGGHAFEEDREVGPVDVSRMFSEIDAMVFSRRAPLATAVTKGTMDNAWRREYQRVSVG
jgi:hypothetical protein